MTWTPSQSRSCDDACPSRLPPLRRDDLWALFFLALCSTPVHAQQRYLLEETTAARGKAAFEAAQKDYCAAVLRCGAPQCLVFSPTTLSPGGLFFTLLRFSRATEG